MAGAGKLDIANVTALLQPTAQFAGAGALSISIQAPTKYIAFFPMAGTGTLNVPVLQRMAATATLAGAGALTVPVQAWLSAGAPLVGAGALTASGALALGSVATWAGSGALAADTPTLQQSSGANLTGAGRLTVTQPSLLANIFAAMAGAGGLTVDITRWAPTLWAGSANLAGAGLLPPLSLIGRLAARPAPLAGAGALAPVVVYKVLPAPPQFAGAGKLIVNATQVSNYSTLDPTHKAAGITLSGGNLIATAANTTGGSVRGTASQNSGKRYFEVTIGTQNTSSSIGVLIGLCNSSFAITTAGSLIGADAGGNSWGAGATSGLGNPYSEIFQGSLVNSALVSAANGDVIGVVVDFTAGNIWFAANNNWFNHIPTGGIGDFTFTPGTPLWPGIYMAKNPNAPVATFNPGSSTFVFTPPSGFVAWG
jgi:hypothetical protein